MQPLKIRIGILEHVNYTSKNTFLMPSRGTPRQESKIFTDVNCIIEKVKSVGKCEL